LQHPQDSAQTQQTDGKYEQAKRHVRAHWEYSSELVEIIKQYKEKFPEVIASVLKCRKMNSMPDIKDVLGSKDGKAIDKLKEIAKWIDSLPISNLPFVDMGFDTLDPDTI